jgi:hypothetical protein
MELVLAELAAIPPQEVRLTSITLSPSPNPEDLERGRLLAPVPQVQVGVGFVLFVL